MQQGVGPRVAQAFPSVTCRVTVHKAGSLPPIVQNLNYPLIENANECKWSIPQC